MSASPAGSGDESTSNDVRDEAIAILEDSGNEPLIRAVEGLISGNASLAIAKERVEEEKIHRANAMRREKHFDERELPPIISEIRGYVFEKVALSMLSEDGEPLNRELSDLLIDVCKRPGHFLGCVKTELNKEFLETQNPAEKASISHKLHDLAVLDEGLNLYPRVNDAIAVQSKEVNGKTTVEIVGSYEMKNCKVPQAQHSADIIEQLKESRTTTVATLGALIHYLPDYYRFYKRCTGVDIDLPLVSNVVAAGEFKQTVVQPDFFGEDRKAEQEEYVEQMKQYTSDVRFLNVKWATVDRIAQALVLDVETQIHKIKYPRG